MKSALCLSFDSPAITKKPHITLQGKCSLQKDLDYLIAVRFSLGEMMKLATK